MTDRILPALLASAIALGSAGASAAPPMKGAIPPKIDTSPTQQRLRMRLEVIRTTDASEGPGNTEDEVYYAIAGVPYMNDSNPRMKTVKRAGDPDVWQMGPSSAPTLHRTLFVGKSSPLWANTFMLVIGEQDNQWMGTLEAILSGGLQVAIDASNGLYSKPSDAQALVDKLDGEFKAIAQRVKAEKDQIIGAIAITMKGSKLTVEADADLHSQVIDDDPKHPVIRLKGKTGYEYELSLVLEDVSTTPPVIHDFIGVEQDSCGGDLWLDTAAGSVQLKKGKRKGFVPESHEFNWYCDGTEEITRASPATDYVIASRAKSGGQIVWRIFKDYTPGADLSW